MDDKFQENVIQLTGLVLSLQNRVLALEKLCLVLATQQGLDTEAVQTLLKKMAAEADEKMLLEVGDQDPLAAELADVLGRLKRRKEDQGS